MKQLFTICLSLFMTSIISAQSQKEIITQEAQTYYDYMTNQNFDGVLDYMYPKVFEMASRDQMKMGMQQMFNSPDMKIEFLNNDVTNVSDEKVVEGVTYAAVYYNSKMRMTFVSELEKPDEDKQTFINFMKSTMATQFGEENVESDAETMSLVINMDATMFAIKDPKFEGWKFLGNDDAMQMIVNSIIPESVRTELLKKE